MTTERKLTVLPFAENIEALYTSDCVEVIRGNEVDVYMVVYFEEDFSNNTESYYSLISLTNAGMLCLNSEGNAELAFTSGSSIVKSLNNEKGLKWRKIKKINFQYSL